MLERKFIQYLEDFIKNEPNKILLVNGARQIGKSYIIRYVGKKLFKHFVEINTANLGRVRGVKWIPLSRRLKSIKGKK